jgi:hypothetical protein
MKKVFCILFSLIFALPVFADEPAVNKATVAATASYVDGAYNTLDTAKQDKLTSTNVVESGSGAMVTNVSASNGTVTVTKTDVTIPVGSVNSATRARIWVQ